MDQVKAGDRKPVFFLSADGEYAPLRDPRACWVEERMSDGYRDDYMRLQIEPSLIGQPFGVTGDIDQLLISSKWEGTTLYPISRWPMPVYIFRILDETIIGTGSFLKGQVEMIAWGLIYNAKEEIVSL